MILRSFGFLLVIFTIIFFSVIIKAEENNNQIKLSKYHKKALHSDCKINLKKEFTSIHKCKLSLEASIRKNGELIDVDEFDEDLIADAESNCVARIKKGLFKYNSCLAEVLQVDITYEEPPVVVENDGSGELEDNEIIIASADQIYKKVILSTYYICVFDNQDQCQASGSAVIIKNNYLATNCHVVFKSGKKTNEISNIPWKHIWIINSNDNFDIESNWSLATIYKKDIKNDSCILYDSKIHNPAVKIKKIADIKMLEQVYAVGNPEGKPGVMTEGVVQRVYPHGYWGFKIPVIQSTAHIRGGSSGGGLYDSNASLIGITSGQNIADRQEDEVNNPFNIALAAEKFIELLNK